MLDYALSRFFRTPNDETLIKVGWEFFLLMVVWCTAQAIPNDK